MSRFVRPALAAAVLALASGPALAADLPSRKAPPPVAYVAPPPVFTWTGFYVGLNAGAAIDNTRYGWSPFSPDYRPGGVPRLRAANRVLCLSCHQNAAPLFARQTWDETSASPHIARLLAETGRDFYGIRSP